jgi:hypothetical protein
MIHPQVFDMKQHQVIGGLLMLAAILAGWWWFSSSEKLVVATAAARPKTTAQLVTSTRLASATPAFAPKAPPISPAPAATAVAAPVVAPAKPTGAETTTAENTPADLRAELAVAQADIALLLRSGEYMAFVQKYTPPQKLAAMSEEELAGRRSMDHNPQSQPMFNTVADALENLKDQTPVFNAAGDRAVYMVDQPSSPDPQNLGPQPITFVKVDGRWYKEPTVMTTIDGKWYIARQNPPQ